MDPQEKNKFWEIFRSLHPEGGYVSGEKACSILQSSRLGNDKLAKLWDLVDIDEDGQLDFDEFSIAMKITFNIINGIYHDVPPEIPDELVPPSKQHLIAAREALQGSDEVNVASQEIDDPEDDILKDGFDWYMPPSDRMRYTDVYSSHSDKYGAVSYNSFAPVYEHLGIPRSQIMKAWNLVNPQKAETIDKDQCLVFLHILTQRSQGFRIPKDVPFGLRASFKKGNIDYNLQANDPSHTMRESQSVGSTLTIQRPRSDLETPKDVNDSDWEIVGLRNELATLEQKITKLQREVDESSILQSRSQLVRRDLLKLLDYKYGVLADLKAGGLRPDYSLIERNLERLEQQTALLQQHLEGKKKDILTLEENLPGR
ncbi:actin cortical patch component End3 [Schizosaccharomyces cryophilus OY26]|uniref:Endocytosis protein 3 n=1 Tax=Schizosaccharomyces cryophilus (strain OY26 / ATCC MYA-4695 / CBS 11777 / NBRC 106824 / NRRL Y48691) TaxID=653667 RepID=S9X782_SCHCR|nr:actin cortical patch component End3 [Schizosaccharomyces cryophilus OY26]EPY52947.1 actin cortical patch component End3 [Schizosaccharomyces cryophilus OY26]